MRNILLAIILICPLASWAQEIKPFDVKLGLWENSISTEIAGMPPMPAMPALSEEQLAKMPPAQRAQLENMMKGRGTAGSPRTTTAKVCITRESLNKALYNNPDKTCTTKLVNATSNSQQIHFECSPGGNKAVGDMNMERVDAEHTKGTMVMKTTAESRSVDMKMTLAGKWVSSDCGEVKPLGEK